MYQQFINENRTHQYQQDCQRVAATERALQPGHQAVATATAPPRSPRPARAWIIAAMRNVLAPAGK
ncbi:MAG TPA: hypothetical protein VFM49_20410 [Chloroflexia bacterium]|nr:hypothetical protein [Chloroflexia bacterium]